MKHLALQLFVAGNSARSQAAIRQANAIVKRYPEGVCEVEVVDVLAQAERQQVIATPTLIRMAPLPAVRIVGDLQDVDRVLALLDPPAGLGRPM